MNEATKFAESINARVVFPSDPKRKVDLFAKTDVRKTWARFKPEPDFDSRAMNDEITRTAPAWWKGQA